VVVFPNCKINLGLNIIGKRNDGFHNIETVFYPISVYDALEVVTANEESGTTQFSKTGETVQGEAASNLCLKAYELLVRDFPGLPAIRMHLHKSIPVGAGLGGGSSDAAFTLKLLNGMFNLGLSQEGLREYALTLGSDCPFFVLNKPSFASGRGEVLNELSLELSQFKFVIVNPGIHINTTEAFLAIKLTPHSKSIKQIIQQSVESWRIELKNDFEETVFEKHPAIRQVKDDLYIAGAIYASMSGTGSTVYGMFQKDKEVPLAFPSNYFVETVSSKI